MKFLCLAYGDEEGWNSLTQAEKDEALAADEALRQRGSFVRAVGEEVRTVTNWSGEPVISSFPYAAPELPLAGFAIIEAESAEQVAALVALTPCARARGYIEIRPFRGTAGDPAA